MKYRYQRNIKCLKNKINEKEDYQKTCLQHIRRKKQYFKTNYGMFHESHIFTHAMTDFSNVWNKIMGKSYILKTTWNFVWPKIIIIANCADIPSYFYIALSTFVSLSWTARRWWLIWI
jgi:hypothetical protein